VGGVRQFRDTAPHATLYSSSLGQSAMTFAVRSNLAMGTLSQTVRHSLAEVDSGLAAYDMRGMGDRVETAGQVLGLYRERYFDLNVRHFHEKLVAEHGIELSYTWVKAVLQGAGLVKRGRKRGVHRKRRPRRPLPGMLLHIDGSHHRWFQDERWYDLLVILDDATSQIYYAQLVEEESTLTVMAALREVIERQGAVLRAPAEFTDLKGLIQGPRHWRGKRVRQTSRPVWPASS
jgi:hypothetical protein